MGPPASTAGREDASFKRLTDRFLADWLRWRPQVGTALGLHEYDGRISDFSRASIDSERARLHEIQEKLKSFSPVRLSARAYRDLRLIQCAIGSELFRIEAMNSFTRNPMTYANALDVNIYIKREFGPLDRRVRSLSAILRKAPEIFAAARANLEDSLPRPYVETAIEVANGAADFLAKDLTTALEPIRSNPVYEEFSKANQMAQNELRAFVRWLETERLPKSQSDYALGRA